jgi:CRP-like cAMP-binding protein
MARARARNTDPATSHRAANRVEASRAAEAMRLRCFRVVCEQPGLTSAEVGSELGVDRYTPARRLPELRDDGLVRNGTVRSCNLVGSPCMTWYPTARGRRIVSSD